MDRTMLLTAPWEHLQVELAKFHAAVSPTNGEDIAHAPPRDGVPRIGKTAKEGQG